MKIGFTGHQSRIGADWIWTERALKAQLLRYSNFIGYSCLAAGSDQIFARAVLELGGTLISVIPRNDYESHFADQLSLKNYRDMLARSKYVININDHYLPEESFFNASAYVVDKADTMFAAWDGKPAAGHGGTAEIVELALKQNKPVLWLNPINRHTEWLGR